MKFGLWDHVDSSGAPLAQLFDDRLEYVAAADDAGFHCYHVAEHHVTPLNMVPVPGVYLGAVARVTKKIRLGPLVYLLPLYSPLCLIEEISILDHLSHGRLDVGVGRGVSPYELNYHNVDHDSAREVFIEILDAVTNGLTSERLNHSGKHYNYSDVPMELAPLQQPHPPIWYGSSSDFGSNWAGENGLNFATLGAVEQADGCIKAYQAGLAKRGGPLIPNPAFGGGTAIGVVRHLVIAESDDEAVEIAQPAYNHWYGSLTKLERNNVQGPKIATSMFADVRDAVAKGPVVVGTPETVRAELERQIGILDINYLILGFYFGTLSLEQAQRSLNLFTEEIMPHLKDL